MLVLGMDENAIISFEPQAELPAILLCSVYI